jgi:hypothetical protein
MRNEISPKTLLFCLALVVVFMLPGCATPEEYEYDSEILGAQEEAESSSALGMVIQEWRAFSIIFLLITVGLISLAYPVSTALNLPELRAWAEVEMGEAFSTVLIVLVVMSVLVFAEVITHGFLLTSNDFDACSTDDKSFCPALVADEYIGMYLDKNEGIYEDLQKNAVKTGKLATMTVGAGINYWMVLYPGVTWRPLGGEVVIVNMLMQELQMLISIRDALLFQEFLINHISLILAPMSLMLGIILRSFFVTRKLGGQLMAFGIGFILVFPATYALAMYSVKTTVYGAEGSGGQAGGEFCTYSCMKLPPAAYNADTGEGYSWAEAMNAIPMLTKNEEEHDNRTTNFLTGQICVIQDVVTGFEGGIVPIIEKEEVCIPNPETEIITDGGTIITCGQYEEICPDICRSFPYPSQNPTCASPRVEYMCREFVPDECFQIKFVNRSDPRLSGLKPYDFEGCPQECRPVVPLKKEGCDVGYGFVLTEELEEDPSEVDKLMLSEDWGYTLEDKLIYYCNDYLWYGGMFDVDEDFCEDTLVPIWYADYNTSEILVKILGYEQPEIGKTIEFDMGCSSECRWITAEDGKTGFGCGNCDMEAMMEDTPQNIWNEAHDAAMDGDLAGQVAAAEKTCVMIVPDIVFEKPSECAGCNYVLDRGFGSLPPVHLDCPRLCGMPQAVEEKTDEDSMTSAIDGFEGPAEMKSISALIVPSIVLPLLNIAITFMFITTLSPIIGGGVDISGMMRFFR